MTPTTQPLPDRAASGASPRVSGRLLFVPVLAEVATQAAAVAAVRPTTDRTRWFFDPRYGLVVVVSYVAFALAVWWVASTTPTPRLVLALRRVSFGRAVRSAALALMLAVGTTLVLEPLFHGVRSQGITPGRMPQTASAELALALTVLSAVVLAPLTEEVFFRGLLYGWLDRFGVPIAVGVSAAVFAASHLEPRAFPVLFVYGGLLGWLRHSTGSVLPGIAMHAANNGLAVIFSLVR